MQKRFVSWEAVSSRPQMDGGSPDDQRERNQAHIEKWGGVLIADLEVPGQSRSYIEYEEAKHNLEAYRQLDALIKAKSFDVLICYNVGRLGRKRSLITTVIDLCHEAGIVVYRTASPPANLEWSKRGYSEMLIEAIESTNYENEIDQLKEHHKAGMKRRIERGYFPGNIPFGWKAEYYERRKYRLHIDENAAKAIRLAFSLYLKGDSKKSIADRLNAEGLRSPGRTSKNQSERTPKLWIPAGIDGLLSRVWVYAGYAQVNQHSHDREPVREKSSIIPPIIDEDTAQQLVDSISSRSRSYPPRGQSLFSGIVSCAHCNGKMYVISVDRHYIRKDGSAAVMKLKYARCYTCKHQIPCKTINSRLALWFGNNENQTLPTDQPEISEDTQKEVQRLQKQLDALPQAKERAYSTFVDGDVDKESYQAQIKRLDVRKRELQEKIRILSLKQAQHRRSEDLQQRYKGVFEAGCKMLELGATEPIEVNRWLREYIRIVITRDKSVDIYLT